MVGCECCLSVYELDIPSYFRKRSIHVGAFVVSFSVHIIHDTIAFSLELFIRYLSCSPRVKFWAMFACSSKQW